MNVVRHLQEDGIVHRCRVPFSQSLRPRLKQRSRPGAAGSLLSVRAHKPASAFCRTVYRDGDSDLPARVAVPGPASPSSKKFPQPESRSRQFNIVCRRDSRLRHRFPSHLRRPGKTLHHGVHVRGRRRFRLRQRRMDGHLTSSMVPRWRTRAPANAIPESSTATITTALSPT